MNNKDFEKLLELGSGPDLEYDSEETLVDVFLHFVGKSPEKIAVEDESGGLTYSELDRCSNVLAHRLIELGVEEGEFVAVNLPRIKEFLLAVLGIWKAGAAYLPLDSAYPEARVHYMLEDSGASITIDEKWIDWMRQSVYDVVGEVNRAKADGVASLLYTSGSTGVPKGVMNTHRGLRASSFNIAGCYDMGPEDIVGQLPSFCFSISFCDLFGPISKGATVFIIDHSFLADLAKLDSFIRKYGINIISVAPQIGLPLINNFHTPFKCIGMGGSNVYVPSSSEVKILAGYGLTETCSLFMGIIYDNGATVGKALFGYPLAGTVVVLEDPDGNPVPRGEVGEVCVGSPQVALGYWNNETLTNEVFVDRPWSKYKVLRTGDLGRWNEDGVMESHGRRDHMVKIRGNRIELGEVETAMTGVNGIKECVVAVMDRGDESLLCGYYISDKSLSDEFISGELSKTLPSFMVPPVFIQMESFPRLPNGKVDRTSLPSPKMKSGDRIAPSNETEKIICECFESVLGLENEIGIGDKFVSVGGNSLSALHLSIMLSKKGISLNAGQILKMQTPEALALYVLEHGTDDIALPEPGKKIPALYPPLHESARFIYLEWEKDHDTLKNNLPLCLHFGSVSSDKLKKALEDVFAAHSYLKMHIVLKDSIPVQKRMDDAPVSIDEILSDRTPDKAYWQSLVKPFGMVDENLYRIFLISVKRTPGCYLFIDFNHVLSDGMSEGIFLKDLSAVLDGRKLEKECWTAFEQFAQELEWSKDRRLADTDQYFARIGRDQLPTLFPSSTLLENNGANGVNKVCSYVKRDGISPFVRRTGITESNIFLTAALSSIQLLTDQENVAITIGTNGRFRPWMMGSCGMFVKTLPVFSRNIAGNTWLEASRLIQDQFIESDSKGYFPLIRLKEICNWRSEICFLFEGNLGIDTQAFHTDVNIVEFDVNVPPMTPLWIGVLPSDDKFEILIHFDNSIYSAADMERLANSIARIAEEGCRNPDTQIQKITFIPENEIKEIVRLSSGEKTFVDEDGTCVRAISENALKYGDYPAIVATGLELTYGDLEKRSNALANLLVNKGLKEGGFVSMLIPESAEFYISAIGIMKAGCGYIPIDVNYPDERIKFIYADSDSGILITSAAQYGKHKLDCPDIIYIDELDWSVLNDRHIDKSVPDGPSMLLYTSGSTGRPKGALHLQQSLWTMTVGYIHSFSLSHDKNYAAVTSPSYALSLCDTYGALVSGATLFVVDAATRKDLNALAEFLNVHSIAGIGINSSLGAALINNGTDLSLHYMIFAGEKIPGECRTHIRLYNGLGSTETHYMTYHRINPETDETIPLGRPAPNLIAVLLDSKGNLVPLGQKGEICIVGQQLARGYWKQERLTAEKFSTVTREIADAFSLKYGTPVYHTGDLAYWNADGELVSAGRKDNLVKVSGFRVELGEIENVALRHKDVDKAVAVLWQEPGRSRICLFYSSSKGIEPDVLRRYLRKYLAPFMMPAIMEKLDSMPINPNGKIDRKSLSEPHEIAHGLSSGPQSNLEDIICHTIACELGVEKISSSDNLISLGLSSLSAIKVCATLAKVHVPLNMGDLLRCDNVADLCEYISNENLSSKVGRWLDDFDESKKTAVLFCGIIGTRVLLKNLDQWRQKFNIYVFDHVLYSWSDINSIGFNEIVGRYMKILLEEIKTPVHVFFGFSFGGLLAYDMAEKWMKATGEQVTVFMGDAILSNVGLANTVVADDSPEGKYNQMLLNFCFRIIWDMSLNFYPGRVILTSATKCLCPRDENEEYWKKLCPHVEIEHIPDSHLNSYMDAKYYAGYLELLG